MKTYAVVDDGFSFVKVGRTGNVEARMATLNTAQPRPLLLMATFDGDIEAQMHALLSQHKERLEWFRYNDEVEDVIRGAMNTTREWLDARGRFVDKKLKHALELCGETPQYDHDDLPDAVERDGDAMSIFRIPDERHMEKALTGGFVEAIPLRGELRVCKLLIIREISRLLSTDYAGRSHSHVDRALFAAAYVKGWKRRLNSHMSALGKQARQLKQDSCAV